MRYEDIVSIHAPRVGRDLIAAAEKLLSLFQFTRPAWGATAGASVARDRGGVSIHAPRVGRDTRDALRPLAQGLFQFTRPAWGATRSG